MGSGTTEDSFGAKPQQVESSRPRDTFQRNQLECKHTRIHDTTILTPYLNGNDPSLASTHSPRLLDPCSWMCGNWNSGGKLWSKMREPEKQVRRVATLKIYAVVYLHSNNSLHIRLPLYRYTQYYHCYCTLLVSASRSTTVSPAQYFFK